MTKGLNCSARALEHIPICYNYTSVAVRRVVADFSDLCNVLPVFFAGQVLSRYPQLFFVAAFIFHDTKGRLWVWRGGLQFLAHQTL